MALVASSSFMAESEKMLMGHSRFRPPRISSAVQVHKDVSVEDLEPEKPFVKRKQSWERAPGPPRSRKKVFSYTTDPEMETYKGHVRAPADAIVLFEACRLGLLPRVQRRLSEKERQSIKSGSVFVWDEREAGMRRWTDGKSWSASRVSGSFLTYREMEGKRGGGGGGFPNTPSTSRSNGTRTPESGRGNESELDAAGGDEGPDGYRYKPDGLMKQSFSITTSSGNHLHLISYYSRSHPASQQLPTPSTDPSLHHIRPAKGMYPESTVHEHQNIPAVTRSPMANTGYQTVPQMANYARNPPQWSPQSQQQYGWSPPPGQPQPPPPSSQPPYPYQFGNPAYPYHPQLPPQPSTNGHSPLPYSHGGRPPSSHPPTPSNPPYEDRRAPPTSQAIDPGTGAIDSRRPPPAEGQKQPPVNHPHETVYGYESREGHQHAPYDSKNYPPRSTGPQEHRQPPSAQYQPQQNRPPSSTYYSQPQSQYYSSHSQNPSPATSRAPPLPAHHPSGAQYQQPPPGPYPSPGPPAIQIDPRLTTSSSQPQHTSYPDDHGRIPTNQMGPTTAYSPSENRSTQQQASTVPSIDALMNGSSDRHGYSSTGNVKTRSPPGQSQPTMANGSADRSPINGSGGAAVKKEGPQDISSERLGFSEDQRAIKVLDKGFR